MSTTRTALPIHCTPCRVKYLDTYYKIPANGEVRETWSTGEFFTSPSGKRTPVWQVADEPETPNDARVIRREASRQRCNRNARERAQAMRDLGMTRTTSGQWE